jgi:hypothetical protein
VLFFFIFFAFFYTSVAGRKSLPSGEVMRVAERNREAVRRVVGTGRLGKPKQNTHHTLHRCFIRPPAAAHAALDEVGRIFAYGNMHLGENKQQHAPGMAHGYSGRHVTPKVKLFNRRLVGLEIEEERAELPGYVREALAEIEPGVGADDPVRPVPAAVSGRLDASIPDGGKAGVNPENTFAFTLR